MDVQMMEKERCYRSIEQQQVIAPWLLSESLVSSCGRGYLALAAVPPEAEGAGRLQA